MIRALSWRAPGSAGLAVEDVTYWERLRVGDETQGGEEVLCTVDLHRYWSTAESRNIVRYNWKISRLIDDDHQGQGPRVLHGDRAGDWEDMALEVVLERVDRVIRSMGYELDQPMDWEGRLARAREAMAEWDALIDRARAGS